MRIGLQITGQHITEIAHRYSSAKISSSLTEIAKTADRSGFYSLWLPDHLLSALSVYGTPIDTPMLEGYSTISYLAAVTSQIKVGLLVTCNFFRHPALLVKTVTTLDIMSEGRAYFGIGAGWFEREAKGFGYEFPSMYERIGRLEETLMIAEHMWRGVTTPFKGRYYVMKEPLCVPQPISRPYPPILIGGSGERKILRLVAKYGDACNFPVGQLTRTPSSIDGLPTVFREGYDDRSDFIRGKFDVLKRHCRELNRPYEDIEKTITTTIKLDPGKDKTDEIISLFNGLSRLGVQHVILNIINAQEVWPVEEIGEKVIPKVAGI